jgi:hypothetical protein
VEIRVLRTNNGGAALTGAAHDDIEITSRYGADSTPAPDDLLDALRAVLEAIDIPHAATVGDQELRDRILVERTGHVAVMLRGLLAEDSWQDWEWSTAYLRERLAELPFEGKYKTWETRAAELEAARKASPAWGAK